VKKFAVIVFVLCSCVTACDQEDTKRAHVWPARTVEPRLTGAKWQPCRTRPPAPGRVVADAECGAPGPRKEKVCDDILDHADAVRTLALQPRCTDNALDALERFARTDAAVLSDVAAAYYVRAQRDDRASDLLRALDAANRATAARPSDAAARFNLALVQETIGLKDEAIASWEEVLRLDHRSDWAAEAREHLGRLRRAVARNPSAEWARNRSQLPAALRARNEIVVARLIRHFPRSAQQYFEDEVLPLGDLDAVTFYARILSARLSGDPYFNDAARVAADNHDGQLALREGHIADSARTWILAAESYAKAARLLRRGGSPLYLEAERGRAGAMASDPKRLSEAAALLATIEREADARGYRYLLALIRVTRGYVFLRQNRYVEAIAADDAARATFDALKDAQSLASLYRTKTGIYRLVGQNELSLREALQALRYGSNTADIRIRHVVIGETAATVRALGYAEFALQLQESAVRLLQKELVAVPPERLDELEKVRGNLSSARREQARIELELRDYTAARRDLDEAIHLNPKAEDLNTRRVLDALIGEVEGRALMQVNPAAAAAAFSRALQSIQAGELRTFRASLLASRAEAERKLRQFREAERDLEEALRELRGEEQWLLEHRKRGDAEEIWRFYFSRFTETYQRLIGQLVAEGRQRDAFAYAERARAFEPLDLILQLDVVPQSFRKLVKEGQPIAIEDIQASLPRGTFLLEYCVTADRTYTWIVSRDDFRFLDQKVRSEDVQRWTEALQQAGRRRDSGAFNAGLDAPFERLIAAPLSAIAGMTDGGRPRLVIIPDGAMHGLPFAALRNSVTQRHLVEEAPIEIAGSATLYIYSLLRDQAFPSGNASALLIGDPAFDPASTLAHGLSRLPAARREVGKIRAFYEPNVDVRTGADATIEEFLRLARDKTVVHVAGHSIVNAQEPSRSMLLLASSSQNHSGAIEAQELLTRLKLDQTRLVVLSACSSAGGFPTGPEGVAPLVRPLIAAGVPAVMGTLWDVEDATAEALSVSFHRHYGQGSDAAEALQHAQLELLRNGNRGLQSALAWAPFQVIGHASSPFESTQRRLNGGTHLGIHRTHSLHRDDRIHP